MDVYFSDIKTDGYVQENSTPVRKGNGKQKGKKDFDTGNLHGIFH